MPHEESVVLLGRLEEAHDLGLLKPGLLGRIEVTQYTGSLEEFQQYLASRLLRDGILYKHKDFRSDFVRTLSRLF